MDGKRVIQLLSVDSKAIYDRLVRLEVGEMVTYSELSNLINRNIQSKEGRFHLYTAQRRALNENYMVFGCIRNMGVKRLNDEEIVGTGHHTIGRIRRMSRRGFRVVTAVKEFDKLPNAVKIQHNTYASLLGAMSLATTEIRVRKLEDRVQVAQCKLSLEGTLKAITD